MSITLHPSLGVNPRLVICRRCGSDTNELILLGIKNRVGKCSACGAKVIGGMNSGGTCPACNQRASLVDTKELRDHEKLPVGLCASCEVEMKEHAAIVADGGVYWRCKDCRASGVIKAESAAAKAIREGEKVAAPEPPCIELDNTTCPACSKQHDENNNTKEDSNDE
jgi:hypothetical protein